MNTRDNQKLTDRSFSELLKKGAMTAPPSPWFTKKIMNRLPERRRRTVALGEYAIYLLAAIATLIYGAVHVTSVMNSGLITVGDIALFGVTIGLFLSIAWLMISPWFRQSMN